MKHEDLLKKFKDMSAFSLIKYFPPVPKHKMWFAECSNEVGMKVWKTAKAEGNTPQEALIMLEEEFYKVFGQKID